MTPRLSGRFSKFGLVFFVLKSPVGIARQWSHEKFAPKTSQSSWNFNISNAGYCKGLIEMGGNGGVDL